MVFVDEEGAIRADDEYNTLPNFNPLRTVSRINKILFVIPLLGISSPEIVFLFPFILNEIKDEIGILNFCAADYYDRVFFNIEMLVGIKSDNFIFVFLRTKVHIWQILVSNKLHIIDFIAQFKPHRKVNGIVSSKDTEMGVILVPDLDGHEMLETDSVSNMWILFFI